MGDARRAVIRVRSSGSAESASKVAAGHRCEPPFFTSRFMRLRARFAQGPNGGSDEKKCGLWTPDVVRHDFLHQIDDCVHLATEKTGVFAAWAHNATAKSQVTKSAVLPRLPQVPAKMHTIVNPMHFLARRRKDGAAMRVRELSCA